MSAVFTSGTTGGRRTATDAAALRAISAHVRPLVGAPADFEPLLEMVGDARFVLLGEASHGTSEFYTWRAALSKRLIEEKGFAFIAVEGDWPDCYRVKGEFARPCER